MTTTTTATEVTVPLDTCIASARELSRAGRWTTAQTQLDQVRTTTPEAAAALALASAAVAYERDYATGSATFQDRLREAERAAAAVGPDAESRWDLDFLVLQYDYSTLIFNGGAFRPGPVGKDPAVLAELRSRGASLRDRAPDVVRTGWGEQYLGFIADNLYGERDVAPTHYERALVAGESGDDLLTREALRHLGDHDHDDGRDELALERWGRATALGARAGYTSGTLSQQMLLAVLARDKGDEAGAVALATEIERWATAMGALRVAARARDFLAGIDPTAAPDDADR
ncbi:hypothetical protein [Luteipulveratus mongoliensis]|uniref:Uncharacterized protein n=1 Tax=Luteipulveratus mongoliensis TaxID=571913 RepID=A0A0K1JMV7_9MICO|nr:hypothetical protein [Luteipulveratus mongoliensis]AKU18041.1 hypothetical protein VV02_22870 [Luteipulveratus mongoliensis]